MINLNDIANSIKSENVNEADKLLNKRINRLLKLEHDHSRLDIKV